MKSKKIVVGIIAVALSASMIGGLGIALKGFNSIENTTGTTTTDTTSYVSVGELWNSSSKSFNQNNVEILYKYLTGNESASYSNVTNLASSITTASTIRSKTLSAGTGYSAKSSSQDIVVTLGGLEWTVVYLSNDTDGNPVLTLWLSNSTQDAFSGRSRTEGAYYGYVNGELYSDWSGDWQDSTVGYYPSNMYGTSYIRVVTLNNGGNCALSSNSSTGTINPSTSSVFAPFTVGSYGMMDYIVKPIKMSWQRDQKSDLVTSRYIIPNEAIAPSNTSWCSGYDYSGKTNYTAWGNDNLWLPSLTEIGHSDSAYGIWRLSKEQRKNVDSSYGISGTIGSANTKYTFVGNDLWLRSGMYNKSGTALALSPVDGSYSTRSSVANSYAVRPALHLNLKKVNEDLAYILDLNGRLDNKDSGDITGYATCDIYIDGVKVKSGVSDYYVKHPYGTKYEIKNIQYNTDKAYVGMYKGSLTGTITGNASVYIQIRTKTWEDYAASSYASGSGTETNPYIIKTPEQLGKLALDSRSSDCASYYYKLGGNIDLSAHLWLGIGSESYKFSGNFNGDMYTIKNIFTTKDFLLPRNAGLFSNSSGGVILNLIVKDSQITGDFDTGAIIAVGNSNSTLRNCIVENTNVTIGSYGSIGGIVGANANVYSCVFRNGEITRGDRTDEYGNIGGIAGWLKSCSIEGSSVINADILCSSATQRLGILVGTLEMGIVKSSYGQGTVNNSASKVMYGDSNAWEAWSYHPSLNGGYPMQKSLFHIGGITGSQNVYNYLTGTLKFSVA